MLKPWQSLIQSLSGLLVSREQTGTYSHFRRCKLMGNNLRHNRRRQHNRNPRRSPEVSLEEELTPKKESRPLKSFTPDPLAAQEKRDQKTIKAWSTGWQKNLEKSKAFAPVIQQHAVLGEVDSYTNHLSDFAQAHRRPGSPAGHEDCGRSNRT